MRSMSLTIKGEFGIGKNPWLDSSTADLFCKALKKNYLDIVDEINPPLNNQVQPKQVPDGNAQAR
jgi:hypothetical protein